MCLRGWKQWFSIQSATHSKVNEHLEELNVFQVSASLKEIHICRGFFYACACVERVRGQRWGIHADGNINTLDVRRRRRRRCGLHIPQTSVWKYERSKLLLWGGGCGGGVFSDKPIFFLFYFIFFFAADERLSMWTLSKNTHNNRVFETPVS